MRLLALTGALLLTSAAAQAAPRTWHFTCDYYNLDLKGHLTGRQRFSALYTRGLADNMVRWGDVTVANGNSWDDKFGAPQKQGFMEGFTYAYGDIAGMMKSEFFHGFPESAIQQRNLVWDTHMLEGFVNDFDKLKPNVAYHVPDSGDMQLAGAGTFHNRDLQLTLTGTTKRNGRDCAVMDYRAMFNTLDTKLPGIELIGRSDFWGQIWVGPDRQIEYATLYEEVIGELTFTNQQKPMNIAVVRVGVFEPVGQ